jgi:segregation and condensation protein B
MTHPTPPPPRAATPTHHVDPARPALLAHPSSGPPPVDPVAAAPGSPGEVGPGAAAGSGGGPESAAAAEAGRGTSPGPGAAADPGAAGEVTPGAAAGSGAVGEVGPGAGGFEGDSSAWPPDEVFEAAPLDDRGWVRRDLEAILLVADEPVPAAALAELVGSRLSEVEELLIELAGEYARDGRGFVLRAIAGGWRLYTHPGARTAVEAFLQAGQQSRLTRAALETLAVIAYRQPVTRFQVAAVRGVNVDGVFRTLLSRGLIQEVGSDPGPGQATLYGTTSAFLEQLGLNSLDQLPPIKDYLPDGIDLVELEDQP